MRKTALLGLCLFTVLVLTACIRKADMPSKVKPIPNDHQATMYLSQDPAMPAADTTTTETAEDSTADAAQ